MNRSRATKKQLRGSRAGKQRFPQSKYNIMWSSSINSFRTYLSKLDVNDIFHVKTHMSLIYSGDDWSELKEDEENDFFTFL